MNLSLTTVCELLNIYNLFTESINQSIGKINKMSGGRIRGAMVAGLRLQSVQWSAVESMLGIDSNICNVLFCRGTKTCVKKVPVQLSQVCIPWSIFVCS